MAELATSEDLANLKDELTRRIIGATAILAALMTILAALMTILDLLVD